MCVCVVWCGVSGHGCSCNDMVVGGDMIRGGRQNEWMAWGGLWEWCTHIHASCVSPWPSPGLCFVTRSLFHQFHLPFCVFNVWFVCVLSFGLVGWLFFRFFMSCVAVCVALVAHVGMFIHGLHGGLCTSCVLVSVFVVPFCHFRVVGTTTACALVFARPCHARTQCVQRAARCCCLPWCV